MDTGHIGLNVSDLERSKKFYQDAFGFSVKAESNEDGKRFVFLADGERLALTLWQQSDGRFENRRPGLHHLSFQASTIEEVRKAEKRLRDMNARFIYDGIVPHVEGSQSGGIFFEDPDGIRLEIYSPTGAGDRTAPAADGPSCGFF